MAGLTFKNRDTFHAPLLIYLRFMALGLGSSLTVGCTQIPTNSSSITIPKNEKAQYLPITARAKMGGQVINLEVTRTISEQSKGLMFRNTLPDDRGMLFNFDPPQAVSFWMQNVPVPLDMVFIYQSKIVAIASSAAPCKANPCAIYPSSPVFTDLVIELRSGLAKEIGLKLGDLVTVENF